MSYKGGSFKSTLIALNVVCSKMNVCIHSVDKDSKENDPILFSTNQIRRLCVQSAIIDILIL